MKFLKILWWLLLFQIIVLIFYVFFLFAILHSIGWSNIQISTITTLYLPYILFGAIAFGVYMIKRKK